ncbi:MAG: CvpA family protein [Clostridia bacterium]|nr:CvpA family protein [Clostridia bacterium]
MNVVMGIILDLIIIGIIVLSIFLSARHGFIRSFIEVVGFIAAIVIAFTISSPLANATYDKIIGPKIVSNIQQITSEGGGSVAKKIWDSFPSIIKRNTRELGINEETFLYDVDSAISSGASDSAAKISKDVTKPLIVRITSGFYTTVLVGVLLIFTRFLAKFLNRTLSVSLIGRINAFLGGTMGLVKGVFFSIVFCAAISIFMFFTENGLWLFTQENIADSYLFRFLYNYSPFV